MQVMRTIFWVLLAVALVLFAVNNWVRVDVRIWEGLVLDTPLAGPFQEQTIRDLERTMPAVIVWSTSGASWLLQKTSPPLLIPYLKQMLQQFYTLQGGWIREGTEKGYWKGNITDADKNRSSLLVYRRK